MLEVNKVHCGDCLKLMRDIEEKTIDCIIIDPPYNEVDMDWDKLKLEWKKIFQRLDNVMKNSASLYIFGKQPFLNEVLNISKKYFEFRFELIWFKNAPAPHSSNYQPLKQHENIFCFTKKGFKVTEGMTFNIEEVKTKGQGYKKLVKSKVQRHRGFKDHLSINEGRFPISVIYAEAVRGGSPEYTGHNTQKPLSLMRWLIALSTNRKDLVLDCFAGSGSTLVACKQLNRNFIGIEIEPKHIEICKRRLSQEILDVSKKEVAIPPNLKRLGILATFL